MNYLIDEFGYYPIEQQNVIFRVTISTSGNQLYLYSTILIPGEITSILQSPSLYRWSCPHSKSYCPRWVCKSGLVQKKHPILPVTDSEMDMWPNWNLKDTIRFGRDFCESHHIFRGIWIWKVLGLNLLGSFLLPQEAWKWGSREEERRTTEGNSILMALTESPNQLCSPTAVLTPDFSIIVVNIFPSFLFAGLSHVKWLQMTPHDTGGSPALVSSSVLAH